MTTTPIDPFRALWDRYRNDEGPSPPAPGRPPAAPRDPSEIPELPDTQGHLLALATRAANRPTARESLAVYAPDPRVDQGDVAKARLDAFMAQWKPAYRLPTGETVAVAAPFRMNPGWAPIPGKNNRLLRELGPLVGVSRAEVDRVQAGRGTAEQVRRLTDALLRAGKLPSEPHDWPAPLRVRKMMFDYGIGIDCAGYVQQASAAARGVPLEKAGFRPIVEEDLSQLARQGYRRVGIEDVRPGDVVVLGPPTAKEPGHRVIVADARPANDGEVDDVNRALRQKGMSATRDTVKVYTVDSSWGDDNNPAHGGVMREKWLRFDDGKAGVWLEPGAGRSLRETPRGPYDHPLLGMYRPNEVR